MASVETVAGFATPRLRLRPPRRGDEPALVRWLGDPEVARRLAPVPQPYTRLDADGFVALVQDTAGRGDAVTFALTLRDDDQLIGIVGTHGLRATPEIGYWLGRPYWGRGLMSEAVARTLAHVFDDLGTEDLRSGVFAGNDASLAVQRKFGFEEIGRSRRYCMALGAELPHIDTQLTRERYLRLRST